MLGACTPLSICTWAACTASVCTARRGRAAGQVSRHTHATMPSLSSKISCAAALPRHPFLLATHQLAAGVDLDNLVTSSPRRCMDGGCNPKSWAREGRPTSSAVGDAYGSRAAMESKGCDGSGLRSCSFWAFLHARYLCSTDVCLNVYKMELHIGGATSDRSFVNCGGWGPVFLERFSDLSFSLAQIRTSTLR